MPGEASNHHQLDQQRRDLSPKSRKKVMSEIQNEKKLTDKKVVAVREVVQNASTNDIILALHNFDMDVQRTIQAFCDDHSRSFLNSWSSGENAKQSKNKKRRQKQQQKQQQELTVTAIADSTTTTPSDARSVSSSAPYSSQSPLPPPTPVTTTAAANNSQSTFRNHHHLPPAPVVSASSNDVNNSKVAALLNGYYPLNDADKGIPMPHPPTTTMKMPTISGGGAGGTNGMMRSSVDEDDRDPNSRRKAIAKEVKNLSRHDAVIERVQSRFTEEIDKGQIRMRKAFEEMHSLLSQREAHLKAELLRCRDEGVRTLTERAAVARDLHQRSARVAAMSDREVNELRQDIKHFTADRKYEEELGSSIRFQYAPDPAIAMIQNFGEVVPLKSFRSVASNGGAKPQQHSSHSSLVSSVGEDSGLGMMPSPPSSQHTAKIDSGGIEMKSDQLTEEQLADLNRRLQESLKNAGISEDVVKVLGGGASTMQAAPRRRGGGGGGWRGRGGGPRGGYGGRGGGGGGWRGAAGGGSAVVREAPPPKLSILGNDL